jgi:hypothetical protein
MDIKKILQQIDKVNEGSWDNEDGPDYDDDGFNYNRFARKGSALHTASENDPRDQECPTCGEENVLTRRDVARGYQCDDCADRAEGKIQYESKKPSLKDYFHKIDEDTTSGMKPLPMLDPKKQQVGAAVITSTNPTIQKILKNLTPQDVQVIQTMTKTGQPNQSGTQTTGTNTSTSAGSMQPMKEASDSEPTVNGKVVDVYSLDFEDIDTKDYPDFADAYVVSGSFEDGSKMSDADLEKFQDEHRDLVHRLIHDRIYEGSISKIARNKNKIDEISKAKVLKHIKAADKKAVELGKQGMEKYKQGDREGGADDLAKSGKYYKMSSPHAGLGHKKLAGVGVKVPATGAEPVEVQYVITKIGRTPGKKSGLGGQTIQGVTIKDVYTDKAEAEKHAKHLSKYNPAGYEVIRVVEQGVAEGVNVDPQEIANKLTSGKNLDKLNAMAHDSTIYNALDRYFDKHGIPESIYNRVAAIVFKKLDDHGRRLSTDPRLQGVAEGSDLDQQAMAVADKLTSQKNLQKLQAMAHDSTVYRALDRYFAKNNIPENIYNRVANIVFKRINTQGVAEGVNEGADRDEVFDVVRSKKGIAEAGSVHLVGKYKKDGVTYHLFQDLKDGGYSHHLTKLVNGKNVRAKNYAGYSMPEAEADLIRRGFGKNLLKVTKNEAEIPSDQVDMGAGLGAGRSNKVLESNMKKTCEAAYHEGKSHGLGGHSYTCRYDEGTDEHMHYHKGFKEGLDECYGISPMRGVVDEAAKWREHPGAHYHDDDNILPVGFDEPEDPLAARQNYLQTAKDYISKRVKNPERARQMAQQYAKTGMKDFKEEDEGLPATVPGMASQAMDEFGMMEDDMDEGVIGGLAGGAIGARLGGVSGAMTGYKLGSAAQDMFQKEGNAFTGALAKTKKGEKFSVGGHTYTDTSDLDEMAFESLDRQLNALLNEGSVSEGISVSISKGQQGGHDSVSVTATDAEADNLLALVRNAGMGIFADEQKATSDYGAPVSDEGHAEVGEHDSILGMMKKMAGIQDSHDSAQEDHSDCGCGQTPCECEEVTEEESEDQMEYEVAEDATEVAMTNADEESEAAEDQAIATADAKEDELNEWANEAMKRGTKEAFTTGDEFMLDTISSGLNKKKSTGQTTIPVIAGQTDRMGYNESLKSWIKLVS